MIYIIAAGLEDARQWCAFNGVPRSDSVYLGHGYSLNGRRLTPQDRIVRTARAAEHPDKVVIEQALEIGLVVQGLTETVHGNLVPRSA